MAEVTRRTPGSTGAEGKSAAVDPRNNGQVVSASNDSRSGLAEVLSASKAVAGAAASLTKRLTADVALQTFEVGKIVVDGAREGRPPADIAAGVINGWVEGARIVLGVDQDISAISEHVSRMAKPVSEAIPQPVRAAAEQVTGLAPIRAALGLTGMTVQEVRWNLKKQGMDLLRRSTALDDPDEHPALARILTELSPDEARLIRFLATTGPHAVVDVVAHNPMTRKSREMLHSFSFIGREAGCIRPQRTPIYLDNLVRLGVVALRPYRLRSTRNYDLLRCQPEVLSVRKPKGKLVRLKVIDKGAELSEFGKVLYQECLETPAHRLCSAPDEL